MEKLSNANSMQAREIKAPLFSSLFFKTCAAFALIALFPYLLVISLTFWGHEKIMEESLEILGNNGILPVEFLHKTQSFKLQFRLIAGTFFFLITGGVLGVGYYLSRRANRLLKSIKKIRGGETVFINPESDDEIGQLAREVNNMVEQFTAVRERDKELSQAKNEFITIVAHHLRTPLTILRWSMDDMLKRKIPAEEHEKHIRRNLGVIEQSVELIGNLLSAVRIEEKRFGHTFKQLNVVVFIEKAVQNLHHLAESRDIRIEFSPEADSLLAYMDPDGILIVLHSLISNAITYTPTGGLVTISCAADRTQGFIEVSIKDTGIGIPPEEMPRLFSQFFRAQNARDFQPNGTGIGLYIAKNIIERHGGTIKVISELHKGSIFTFTLSTLKEDLPKESVSFEKFFEDLGQPSHGVSEGLVDNAPR